MEKIPNHFKLVLVASRRARQLQDGAAPKVEETGNEKPNIVALREIAAGVVNEDILDEPLVKDATADEELAELIAHGLMDQDISSAELGSLTEDAEEGDGEDAGIEMDPLEAGTETIESMEKMADLNLDKLKTGDEISEESDTAQAGKSDEAVSDEKLLSSVDEALGASKNAAPDADKDAGEDAPEGAAAEEKPA